MVNCPRMTSAPVHLYTHTRIQAILRQKEILPIPIQQSIYQARCHTQKHTERERDEMEESLKLLLVLQYYCTGGSAEEDLDSWMGQMNRPPIGQQRSGDADTNFRYSLRGSPSAQHNTQWERGGAAAIRDPLKSPSPISLNKVLGVRARGSGWPWTNFGGLDAQHATPIFHLMSAL